MSPQETDYPSPKGDIALQITALPNNTNAFGDIYGGWLVSQMDIAATSVAAKLANGRVATVAIDQMSFLVPVSIGSQLSFYTEVLSIGHSSIQIRIEVWCEKLITDEWRKVTEAVFVFVAIDSNRCTRSLPASLIK